MDPKYNLLLTRQYKHTGRKEPYVEASDWYDAYYPEQWGPSNYKKDLTKQSNYRYRYRHSPCVVCRQSAEMCSELKCGAGWTDGSESCRDNGDLDFVTVIDLGCFGMAHSGGVVDRFCDNACDGSCSDSLEDCVRVRLNPVCVHPDHKAKDRHNSYSGLNGDKDPPI